jgi:pimeloyl-ACP methyl ester carboxylesterase
MSHPMLAYFPSAGAAANVAASQIARANASRKPPVLFIHGLWLLPSCWDRWSEAFEDEGFAAVAAAWPDDPASLEEANAHPSVFADKTILAVVDAIEDTIRRLDRKPVVIGHSFGGLIAQILAGRGLSAATVAIDPAPFRGVLPLPWSALKSAWPVLWNPVNRHRAVALTYEQFRYAFANAVDEKEAEALYARYAAPAPGAPLFQAAFANFNPWTEDKVNTRSPRRGPLLIMAGELDHTVPPVVANAAYLRQSRNPNPTEFIEWPGRGHALTIDSGWKEVAEAALAFVKRFI